ncbi:MAG: PAS domain-containing protein [Nitrospirae bacterium]|nr:PAS domain-containing protein [Nitrospirota bacterium]
MDVKFVIGAALVFQFAAAAFALRLMRATRWHTAWILISISAFLIAIRRLITLLRLISNDLSAPPDMTYELVGLGISVFMFAGVAWLAPLFFSISNSEKELREAVKKIAEEKARSEAIIAAIGNGMSIQDTDFKIMYQNQTHKDMAGSHVGEYCYKAYNDREKICERCPVEMSFNDGLVHKIEKCVSPGKKMSHIEITASPLKDSAGKTIAGIELVRDITERKHTEELINRLYHKNELILNCAGEGIYGIDTNGNTTFANPAAAKMIGWEPGEIIGKFQHDILHHSKPDGTPYPREECPIYAAFKDGFVHHVTDEVFWRKDGTSFPVEYISTPLKENGRIIGAVVVFRDVTMRKRLEEELRKHREDLEEIVRERTADMAIGIDLLQIEVREHKQAQEEIINFSRRLETIINSSSDIIFLKDKNFRYLVVNEQCAGFLNSTAEDVIGKTDFDFMPEEAAEACKKGDEAALVSESPNESEELVGDRWFHVVKQRVKDSEGNAAGIVAVIRDITERRKMEEELMKAQKLESVGLLAGGIAHDFNNALTGILGNISLAKMLVEPENKIFKRLTSAEKATLRAQKLTHQLLTFAMGGVPIKQIISIAELLEESIDFTLKGSNIRCNYSIARNLWPVEIDEGQINQVISNLAINAQQAMPEGGILKVRAENITADIDNPFLLKGGKYIKISIEDNGIGIPEEQLSRIFDPYFTTKQKGSGLGLATTYSIIKNHDGHIMVESKLGIGTIFHIYLPASGKEVLAKRDLEEGPMTGTGKILIMDDEADIREAAGEALTFLGYEISLAEDGIKTIELYKKAIESRNPFDVVIMDLIIPGGMGGKETVKKLIEIDPHIKAIVSSGYSNDPVMADFKKHGFRDFIIKPYTVEDLGKVLHRVLTE